MNSKKFYLISLFSEQIIKHFLSILILYCSILFDYSSFFISFLLPLLLIITLIYWSNQSILYYWFRFSLIWYRLTGSHHLRIRNINIIAPCYTTCRLHCIIQHHTTLHCTALRFSVCLFDCHQFTLFLFILFHIPFLPSFLYPSIFTLLLFLPSSLSLSFSSVQFSSLLYSIPYPTEASLTSNWVSEIDHDNFLFSYCNCNFSHYTNRKKLFSWEILKVNFFIVENDLTFRLQKYYVKRGSIMLVIFV